MNKLAEIGAALIGGALHHAEAIHGGDLSAILKIELSDGREAIVKNGPAPKIEAAMLRAIDNRFYVAKALASIHRLNTLGSGC